MIPDRVHRGRHAEYGGETGRLPIIPLTPAARCGDVVGGDVLDNQHIDYKNGFAQLAYPWICCDAICTDAEEAANDCYKKEDCWPVGEGPGITKKVFLHLTDVNNCFSARRKQVELVYDDLEDAWLGSVTLRGGTLNLKFECLEGAVNAPAKFRLSWTGCQTGFLEGGASCIDPLIINFGQATFEECCDCPFTDRPAEVNFYATANCRKVQRGRHIDYLSIGNPLPVVARERVCDWDQPPVAGCYMTCGLVATVSLPPYETDCDCMTGTYDLEFSLGGWIYEGGWPNCIQSGSMSLSCLGHDPENPDDPNRPPPGFLRFCLNVVCGVDNTGQSACIDVPEFDEDGNPTLENLDIEFEVSMVDPTASTCTGSCFFEHNMAGWTLASSTCSEGCDPCGEEPDNPTPEEEAAGTAVRPCTGPGTAPDCCVGTILVRIMR